MIAKSPLNILVIDDDELFRLGLSVYLERFGKITSASSKKEALSLLDQNHFDIAFIDLWMNGVITGLDLVEVASKKGVYPVILSSSDDEENVIKAYELGCKDYLIKSNYRDSIDHLVEKYFSGKNENYIQKQILDEIITTDETIVKKIMQAMSVMKNKQNIFIAGETGVGKSKLAGLLNQLSGKKTNQFIHLNCAEIPENLVESELFGHTKGAFTGALNAKKGKLQLADKGTLFLDEIATLSLATQAKLLKAIEDKEFFPVGGNDKQKSDFQLLSATCENLEKLVNEGKFRQDLYFRLTSFKIEIKPLRERPQDISLQFKYFTKKSGRQIALSHEAREKFNSYSWPGNSRELKSLTESLSLNPRGIIELSDLPIEIQKSNPNKDHQIPNLTNEQKAYILKNGLNQFIKNSEKEITTDVYQFNKGKIRPTLKTLQISSTTLYRILDEAGINTKDSSILMDSEHER